METLTESTRIYAEFTCLETSRPHVILLVLSTNLEGHLLSSLMVSYESTKL